MNTGFGNACRADGGLMRMALLCILLGIAGPACAQTVSDNLDRISGARTITYTVDGSTDLSQPVVTFQTDFQGEIASSAISLAFVSQDQGSGVPPPRFAGCHGVEWLADGQPLATARASHRGRAVDGEMVELIDQEITTSWVQAIAAAGSVRYRVCRNEYALTTGDLQAFATIAAKLKGASYSRSGRAPVGSQPVAQPVVEYQGMNWRPKNPDTLFPKRRP